MTTAPQLRQRLADQLAAGGVLRTPAWRAAIEAVPREAFLGPAVFTRTDTERGTVWVPVTRAGTPDDEWLEMANADQTWVTQIDGQDAETAAGPLSGNPTSSSTMPGVVVAMLEELKVGDGDRVLEIGTGTGYSTALMAHRLGEANVTSIDIDPNLAGRARAGLKAVGLAPALVIGDGLLGHSAAAPYDRLVATCSVRHIPAAWTEQVRPGGTILTAVSGWLLGSGLVRLTVTGPGRAEGRFLATDLAYMLARPHLPPAHTDDISIPSPEDGHQRATDLDPAALLSHWTGRFVMQLAAPNAQHLGWIPHGSGETQHLLTDALTHAWALLRQDASRGWLVSQGGSERLWDTIETAITTWHTAQSPPKTAFGLTVTPGQQHIWLGKPDGPSWPLPTTAP